MDADTPCTCIKFPGQLLEIRVYDPFCNGDFLHRMKGSTEEDPMYGLDTLTKIQ